MLVLLAEEAAEVGVEADVEPPNRDLFDVGKTDTGFDVEPKELLAEPPNNEAVLLLLPEAGKRGVGVEEDGTGVVPKVLELLIIDDAKTFAVLVGLDLGRKGFSVGVLRENIPEGGPNEVAPDGVEEKKFYSATRKKLNFLNFNPM